MRACEECGLSIGDSATFCMVCGALVDQPAAAAVETATLAAPGPTLAPDGVEVAAAQTVAGQPVPERQQAVTGQPAVQDAPAADTP
ncbi:MAG TPA: hypothetical protein VIK03_03455, partial [Thermoleophilia bacterium]